MFDNLKVETAALPKVTRTRETGPNPLTDHVSASFAEGAGKSFNLPGENARKAVGYLRSAAQSLGVGIRIVVQDKSGNVLDTAAIKALYVGKSKAHVTVMFEAKTKRKYTPKTESK